MTDIAGNANTTARFDIFATGPAGGYSGTYSGQIERPGDVDWIRIDVTSPILLRFLSSATQTGLGNGDIEILIYDVEGNVMFSENDSGTGENDAFSVAASIPGTYYLAVNFRNGAVGAYSITMLGTGAGTVEEQLTSNDDTYSSISSFARVLGGAGDDIINLSSFETDALGEQGNDQITGNSQWNFIAGGLGNDYAQGFSGKDTLFGDAGDDSLDGGEDDDFLSGGQGYDALSGGNGKDVLRGGADDDLLYGGSANDSLDGGAGNDFLSGGDGSDTYVVNAAGDTVFETVANIGVGGNDIVLSSVSYTLSANVERLTLSGTASINGTGNILANTITGNSDNNTLHGGNDGMVDTLIGGAGNDTYIMAFETPDTVTDTSGTDKIRSPATFSLASYPSIENLVLIGTALNGTGNSGANQITGNNGANTLSGGGGNDRLIGALGKDTLSGGANNDTFVFNTVPNNTSNFDVITDFVSNSGGQNDVIHLENTGAGLFTKLAAGALLSKNFVSNAAGVATNADQKIIYHQASGNLLYDADGNGAGAAVKFAQLGTSTHPAITFQDFFVI